MSWVDVKLGDICIEKGIQTGPFGSQLHQSDYSEVGTPVVMPVDLVDGGISTNRIAYVSEEHVERLARHKLKKGDIVYARRGDVGRCSRVKANEEDWLCGTGCLKLTYDPNKVDSDFLYYALSNPDVIGWVRNHAVGATMPNLNTGILESVPLRIPSGLEEQNRIAEVLSAYDDLIENNRRQIKLLEEAAQRLYREWFVDLRFPGHEDVEFIDGLPEGWIIAKLTDVFNFVRGRSYTGKEIDTESGVKLVNLKNIQAFGGWKRNAEKRYEGTFKDDQRVKAGDIVMAVTDMTKERRLIGHVALVPELGETAIISMDLIKIIPCGCESAWLYALLRYSGIAEVIALFANGTNVLHLKPEMLGALSLTVPTIGIQEKFVQLISPSLERADLLATQCDVLAESRDRLLPKLMSGEIEV